MKSKIKKKKGKSLNFIDHLIDITKESNLNSQQKEALINHLSVGKRKSSRSNCRTLLDRYAKDHYGEYKPRSLLNDAYALRSQFSHGEFTQDAYNESIDLFKYAILDTVVAYYKEKFGGLQL